MNVLENLKSWKSLQRDVASDYVFSVDWISVNVKCESLERFKKWFSQFLISAGKLDSSWVPVTPKRLYKHAEGINGQNIIRIEYSFELDSKGYESDDLINLNGELGKNSGIFVEISGDGLRYLGSEFFYDFIVEASYKWKCHYTRIDLALDFFNSDNKIIPLILDSIENSAAYAEHKPCVISRLSDPSPKHVRDPFKRCLSRSAYLGKRSGAKYIRCYDKCLEQRQRFYNKDKENFDKIPDYWYRLELQIRNSTKVKWVNTIISCLLRNEASLQEIFVDMLTKSFYIGNVKRRYKTYTTLDNNNLWDQFIDDLRQNSYFVEFTYLEYVMPLMDPVKVSHNNRRPNMAANLSQSADDIASDLWNVACSVCSGSTPADVRYRNFLIGELGDETLLTPTYVYNNIVQKFHMFPLRVDDLEEVDLVEYVDLPEFV